MCSIYGAYGLKVDPIIVEEIARQAKDRGRDGGRSETYRFPLGITGVLGNWRATPTPEVEAAPLQPYDRMVHNGTIANDKELGALPGEVDSMTLARVLHRSSVHSLAESLKKVKGSFAIAVASNVSIMLACNYKPVYYYSPDGGATTYFSSMARHFQRVVGIGQAPVRLDPYSALDLLTYTRVPLLPATGERRAVVIHSGGLDSTVVACKLVEEGYEVRLLHFKYGSRVDSRELAAVANIAAALDCDWSVLQVPMVGGKGGPLMDKDAPISGAVEGAEYANEWVPARNLLFVAAAVAFAEAHDYNAVALGNNLEEAGAYPDNEEEFTWTLNRAMPYSVQNGKPMEVLSPVGNLMKHEIVREGLRLKAPLHLTYSCYRGELEHCGQCGPCFMRHEAFRRNGATDPCERKSDVPT